MIRSIWLFKDKYWEYLFKYHTGYCYFEHWLQFVEQQLNQLQLNDRAILKQIGSTEMLQCFLILVTVGLQKMKSEWYKKLPIKKYFRVKKLMKWLDHIKTRFGKEKTHFGVMRNPYYGAIVSSFISLKREKDASTFYETVMNLGEQVWNTKWNSVKCQNFACDKKRTDVEKFYKCKKCRVIRYCSKRCQKMDWNRDNHKRYCRKFRKLRRLK